MSELVQTMTRQAAGQLLTLVSFAAGCDPQEVAAAVGAARGEMSAATVNYVCQSPDCEGQSSADMEHCRAVCTLLFSDDAQDKRRAGLS